MRRRNATAMLVALLGLLGVPSVAAAGDGELSIDDLPEVDDARLAGRISDIDIDRITSIHLDGRIRELTVETTEGPETVVRLDSDILFEFGESKLPEAAPAQIADVVADVPAGTVVSIAGHTDNIGQPTANQTLSEQRAQAVANVISSARPELKLTVEGFGETEPIEPNETNGEDNPDGRAQNRRVEIRYAT